MLLFILPIVVDATSDNNNVQTTRTSIKVARNLDPDAMETLEVKTRTGDIATIVVKKREGRQHVTELTAEPHLQLASSSDGSRGAKVPDPVVVRSDSVYVENENEESKKSRSLVHVDADGVPVITGVREPDDENDTRVWRNARVIDGVLVPNANGTRHHRPAAVKHEHRPPVAPMFSGVWQAYKKKKEPETDDDHRKHGESFDEKYMTDKIVGYIKTVNGNVLGTGRSSRTLGPRMEARVLHAPSASVFPSSAAYSPKTAPRLQSFEESARTPVLQYAHPELGVQAAKYEPPEQPAPPRDGRRQQALSYFGHDIHADRSPFAFEPGLEKESRVRVPPKKYSPHYGFPEKHGKYAPGYYVNDDASFWTVVKNKMKTGVDKMSDWTKPVVDPLVEATHKITGNLGFGNGNRELSNVVKEKLGMVATPSVLLPALGLVAGGAALGLGAVAVGRSVDRIIDSTRRLKNCSIQVH